MRPILEEILGAIDTSNPWGLRDRALLAVAFAAGGRRRSEAVALRREDVQQIEDGSAGPSPTVALWFRVTKTQEHGHEVVIVGRPAAYLLEWISASKLTRGPVFQALGRRGHTLGRGLCAEQFNRIVKTRAGSAGIDPRTVSAHGLRAGFMTQSGHDHIPLPAAMAQSGHRDVKTAVDYYRDVERRDNPAVAILG